MKGLGAGEGTTPTAKNSPSDLCDNKLWAGCHTSLGGPHHMFPAPEIMLYLQTLTPLPHRYPEEVKDPLAALKALVNAAGGKLSDQQKQQVYQELPEAISKASLLLLALAHED